MNTTKNFPKHKAFRISEGGYILPIWHIAPEGFNISFCDILLAEAAPTTVVCVKKNILCLKKILVLDVLDVLEDIKIYNKLFTK